VTKKRSYKVLWNVFLFVICGGSLIYGFLQQRRVIESRVKLDECQLKVDSLNVELERMNQQLGTTVKQLQAERNAAFSELGSKQ
jgi:hypothetical protein